MKTFYFKTICGLIIFFSCQVYPQTEVFSHLNISLEGGGVFPQQNLKQHLNNALLLGYNLETPYYKNIYVHVKMQYSLLDEINSTQSDRNIYFVKSGLGFKYSPSPLRHTFLKWGMGLGLSYYFIHTQKETSNNQYYMDSNESEFGIYPFLQVTFKTKSPLFFRIGASYDIVFSKPVYSQLPNAYLNIGWMLW